VGPAKAYDLLANLDGEGAAKPPTIYRALDFLQEAGLVHKIESLNAYVACGHTSHSHSAVFLICDACKGAEELHATDTSEALRAETRAAGFRMTRAVVEVRGTCRNCTA
jgi:Fur family zinc uptake transcriptional regulator